MQPQVFFNNHVLIYMFSLCCRSGDNVSKIYPVHKKELRLWHAYISLDV